MDQQEWQRQLDAWFPHGVNVTNVEDVPGDSEDTSFVAPRVTVLSVADGVPLIALEPLGIEFVVEISAASFEDYPMDGVTISKLVTSTEGNVYLMTDHLEAGALAAIDQLA